MRPFQRLDRSTVRLVVCPRCGAGEGEHCRRLDGSRRIANHMARTDQALAEGLR